MQNKQSSITDMEKAQSRKGLLVFDAIYGSTLEAAYWVKAIIGHENNLDVKALPQVITLAPYDYVIIGSPTRLEKPTKKICRFIKTHSQELSCKQVCYFLTCGDTDETTILKVPGQKAHLIGGRNYLFDLLQTFPEIKPVVMAGLGGRTVISTLNMTDSLMVWLVEKLAKEGVAGQGLEISETLVPERVEAFANDIRTRILDLAPRQNVEQFRAYWNSLQPASLSNPEKKKSEPQEFECNRNTDSIYYVRTRMKGDLHKGQVLLSQWGQGAGIALDQQVTTSFNTYYHAVKNYGGRELTLHVVTAILPEDPGYVHFSFRSYAKPKNRHGLENDINKAVALIQASSKIIR
ncbi:MAG: hypothetical protein GY850_37920 [bacterium]|nr:hypothetical protein [bacterium]